MYLYIESNLLNKELEYHGISNCYFSYNRPRHVQLTIESLAKNPLARESDLYICSDAPRTKADLALVMRCRRYFEQVQGFRSVEVMKFTENHNVKRAAKFMGDWMSQRHEAWISIEDDIIVHEDFYSS